MVVNYNDIVNAIALAEDVALFNAKAESIKLRNGYNLSAEDDAKDIELQAWIDILLRAKENYDHETCLTDDIVWQVIQNINQQNIDVDCDVSRTFSRHSSSGNNPVPSTYVERVLGLYVDNTNPSKPIIKIFVNPATISGNGTQSSPFSAIGGGGGSGTVNAGTQYRLAYYAANGTAVSQASAITGARALKSDANGVPTHFDTATEPTLAELAFVKGVTSAIQSQINAKLTATATAFSALLTADSTPLDTDELISWDGTFLLKTSWTDTKVFLKTYFDTIYTSWQSTLVSANLTAVNSTQYIVVANATFTDPSPVEGKGFLVYVRNGTATIGGTAYTAAGSIIWRVFHSGAWANYYQSPYNDATSSIQTQLNSKTIDTYILSTNLTAPADATIYYLGINPTSMFTTANRRDFKFPAAHTITTVSLSLEQSVNGSGETVNIYLRNITTGTDYKIGTFASNFGAGISYKVLFTPLSIAVNTTDDWAVKILTPTWATNPTNWTIGMILSGN